jgi:probable HAF family extracellular repeat protein
MRARCITVLRILCVAFLGTGTALAVPYYAPIDLGTLGATTGNVAQAYAINNNGVVVGRSWNSSGVIRPFAWSAGTMVDLDPINGNPAYDYETIQATCGSGVAYAVNSSGHITGTAKCDYGSHAFLYTGSPSTSIDLYPSPNPTPPIWPPDPSTGYGINDGGQIVGSEGVAQTYAFLYNADGSKVDINALISGATSSTAYAINNAGIVVGNYSTSSSSNVPFLYNGSTVSNLPALSGATGTTPKAINGSGHVSGLVKAADGNWHGFYYDGTAVTQLGDLGSVYSGTMSEVRGMNASNQIVGLSYVGSSGVNDRRAVLFNLNGTVTNLNDWLPAGSGWTLNVASAINDSGWITGWGVVPSGATRAFLFKPALAGDANLDGTVNINDLSKVLTNYDKTGLGWADGDFNGDTTVNISDLSNVLTNYDKSVGASAASAIKAVPEPGALALLAAAVVVALAVCARQKRMLRSNCVASSAP